MPRERDPSGPVLGLPGVYGVVDLAVSIKSFVNIELRSQGWVRGLHHGINRS